MPEIELPLLCRGEQCQSPDQGVQSFAEMNAYAFLHLDLRKHSHLLAVVLEHHCEMSEAGLGWRAESGGWNHLSLASCAFYFSKPQ